MGCRLSSGANAAQRRAVDRVCAIALAVLLVAAVLVVSGVVTLGMASTAFAQDRPLRIINGFPPGAGADIVSRLLADKMRGTAAANIIVENRVGAGGQIANEFVKDAPADGQVVLLTPIATMVAYPHSYAKLRYDPFADFAPIAHVADFALALGVGAAVPVHTLSEYVALVRKESKHSNYASASAGSLPHFFGVMFARSAGIELTHVPYKGSAAVLQALLGGEISAATVTLADIGSQARAGKARVLAMSGAKRSPAYPDVPTFKEQGYDIEGNGWYALFGPAKLPKAQIDRLARAAIDAVRSSDLQQKLAGMGMDPTGHGPAELSAILRRDYDKWGPIIRASGFRPND